MSERRKRVANNTIEGNEDNSRGFRIYVDTRTITRHSVIFNERSISSSMEGRGITMNTSIATTATDIKISACFAYEKIRALFLV